MKYRFFINKLYYIKKTERFSKKLNELKKLFLDELTNLCKQSLTDNHIRNKFIKHNRKIITSRFRIIWIYSFNLRNQTKIVHDSNVCMKDHFIYSRRILYTFSIHKKNTSLILRKLLQFSLQLFDFPILLIFTLSIFLYDSTKRNDAKETPTEVSKIFFVKFLFFAATSYFSNLKI